MDNSNILNCFKKSLKLDNENDEIVKIEYNKNTKELIQDNIKDKSCRNLMIIVKDCEFAI